MLINGVLFGEFICPPSSHSKHRLTGVKHYLIFVLQRYYVAALGIIDTAMQANIMLLTGYDKWKGGIIIMLLKICPGLVIIKSANDISKIIFGLVLWQNELSRRTLATI